MQFDHFYFDSCALCLLEDYRSRAMQPTNRHASITSFTWQDASAVKCIGLATCTTDNVRTSNHTNNLSNRYQSNSKITPF